MKKPPLIKDIDYFEQCKKQREAVKRWWKKYDSDHYQQKYDKSI